MKRSIKILILMQLIWSGFAVSLYAQTSRVFPRKEWAKRKASKLGINRDALVEITELMRKAKANGVLIRNGYMVAEWSFDGPASKKIEVQSITKSITAMVLGLALKDGKIAAINDPVKKYYPAFNVGPYSDQITFWHLATATSGIAARRYAENYVDPGNMTPGIESRYTNDHMAELAAALTYIYGETLAEVVSKKVLNKIGAEVNWRQEKEVPIKSAGGNLVPLNAGFAFSYWTAADLARVGWLYLNNGTWNNEQLLPSNFVKQSRTAIEVPVMDFSRRAGSSSTEGTKRAYGLAWRGHYTKSGELIWYMSGNGGQMCVVLPKQGVVFTKINGIGENYQPFMGMDKFEDLLLSILEE